MWWTGAKNIILISHETSIILIFFKKFKFDASLTAAV